jgi:hypothetical protein
MVHNRVVSRKKNCEREKVAATKKNINSVMKCTHETSKQKARKKNNKERWGGGGGKSSERERER